MLEIYMEATGKKAADQESEKSISKKEDGNELIASLKFRNSSKRFKSKKKRPRSKTNIHRLDSTLMKKKVAKSLNKWTKKDSELNGRKNQIKQLDMNSLKKKKKSNFRFQEKKSSLSKSERIENNVVVEQKINKSKREKKQMNNAEQNEACRLQKRTRYLMIKMKLEQNLIDAYSGEGWKGQSREKIRPENELERARKQILKCKLGIRDAVQQLDFLSSVGCIEDSVISPDGSVYHEHIICAKCKSREAFPDNDIILCDGTCNCAFHQKCIDPPLDTKHIPPGDQGWYCKFCECKMEILEAMNAHLGTHFPMDSRWEDIFKEEAALRDGGNSLFNQEEEWPSDDSEDDDYDPERRDNSHCVDEVGNNDNASDLSSSSTSLSWSLDGEIFSGKEGIGYENLSVCSPLDSDEFNEGEVISGRRQRQSVDYKKLYDEMFGKEAPTYEQASEDEDWGPAKKKRREKESDAASTLITLYESEQKTLGLGTEVKTNIQNKTSFRIPRQAVQKLRQAFEENELPCKAVKQNLSEELGLDLEKVNKWFKNARYMALKERKGDGTKLLKSPRKSKEFRLEAVKKDYSDELESNNTKKECLRKNLKPTTSHSNKKQQTEFLLRPCMTNKNDDLEAGEDESLKKLLKERIKKKKKKGIGKGGYREAEIEMERLCKVKHRLESMKQVLLRFSKTKTPKKSHKSFLFQPSTVYVPVAQLKEKT